MSVFGLWLKAERRIFTNFHRQVFCWTDLWYGLTMKDIRSLEDKTKKELDEVPLCIYVFTYLIFLHPWYSVHYYGNIKI